MTDKEAIELALNWVSKRKEVRNQLIALAREKNPEKNWSETLDGDGLETRSGRELRKLYHFPHDLSEERLLNLIGDGQ